MSSAFTSKNRYLAFWLIGGVVLTSYCISKLSSPYHDSESVSADGENSQSLVPEADILLTDFKLVETDGTTPSCKLKADKARIYQQRQIIQLSNVNIDLYNEKGQAMNMAGRSGEVNLRTSDMTLKGKVTGTSAEGLKFHTECVQWSKQNDKLIGPAAVDIYFKDTQISAQRMEADSKEGKLILTGGVETLVRR